MKRLLKLPFQAVWRWTKPLRNPVTQKIEAMIARSFPRMPSCRVSEETGLLMDLMVRELVRLQKQLDHLQQTVEDLAPTKTGLAVVGEDKPARQAAG